MLFTVVDDVGDDVDVTQERVTFRCSNRLLRTSFSLTDTSQAYTTQCGCGEVGLLQYTLTSGDSCKSSRVSAEFKFVRVFIPLGCLRLFVHECSYLYLLMGS